MCSCNKKVWIVFLIIWTWIIATSVSVVPLLVIIFAGKSTQTKGREWLLVLYGTLLVLNILQSIIVFFVLCGVVMGKDYIKLRIGVAVYVDFDMIVYTAIFTAIGEHVAYSALFIAIPILLLMFWVIKSFYKNLLGDAF